MKLRDKLKSLYLHYHTAYSHQTWQDDNLPGWTFAHRAKLPLDHVVL